jgi:methyl-accepting chemotaxis protein
VFYFVRNGGRVLVYSRPVGGMGMSALSEQFARARDAVEKSRSSDLRRGFVLTLAVLAASVWAVSFAAVAFLARRISRPMEQLTSGLHRLASGDLQTRLEPDGTDEVAGAMRAFNDTAPDWRRVRTS